MKCTQGKRKTATLRVGLAFWHKSRQWWGIFLQTIIQNPAQCRYAYTSKLLQCKNKNGKGWLPTEANLVAEWNMVGTAFGFSFFHPSSRCLSNWDLSKWTWKVDPTWDWKDDNQIHCSAGWNSNRCLNTEQDLHVHNPATGQERGIHNIQVST